MDDNITSHWPISLSNGAATLFNLFLPLALVRIMPPDQVGRYKVFFLYVMLGPSLFAAAGLTNGLYHSAGSYPRSRAAIRQSWTWFSGIALALSLAGFLLSSALAPVLRMPLLDLRLFFLYCPFGLAAAFMEDLLIARGDIWKGSLYGAGFQVLRAGAVLAAAWYGRQVAALFWAFVACSVLRAVTGWLLLARSGDLRLLFSREQSGPVLKYAFPVSVAALAGLALSNADQLMLSFRLHPAEFAFYAMGCLTIPPLQILEISVNRVLIPRLSLAFAEKRLGDAAALYAEAVSELFRILLPATVGLIIYSRPIITTLFTHRYADAARFLEFYALFYLSMALPFDAVARATGDGGWIMRASMLFAPFSIFGTWFAINRWGAMGALGVLLAVQFGMRFYGLIYQKRRFGVALTQFLPLREMALETLLVAVAAGVSLALHPLFTDARVWFGVTGLLFMAIYFPGAYVLYRRQTRNAHQPIQVLELVQYLSLGGLERMVFSLSQALHRQKQFALKVAAYDRLENNAASLIPQLEQAGIPFVQWEKRTGFSPRTVTRLLRMMFSGKKHILHAHDLGPLIYGSLTKCLTLGRVQLVVTLHTLLHLQKNRRYRFYFKTFLRFADRIVAVSPGVKAGLVELGIAPERIDIVPNGTTFAAALTRDPSTLAALKKKLMPGLAEDLYQSRWILYLARLHSGKGQDTALAIWSALPPAIRRETVLFFVGPETEPAYVDTLKRAIRGAPDAERVIVAGPSFQPQQWLQAAHLFISASRHEGMPLAPLEAVGSGLPALLSDIPGHAFLKPWAHYFNPDRAEDGAQKVAGLLAQMNDAAGDDFFVRQWLAAEPLRRQWGEAAMVESYKDVFHSMSAALSL